MHNWFAHDVETCVQQHWDTLFFFSYVEAENDWTSRADGADYIDDLVLLGFKKVAQDIPRHKRVIEQTIRDAMAEFAPLLKPRSMGTLGVEPEPLFRRQEYPNPREKLSPDCCDRGGYRWGHGLTCN